jgi:hypothetical protein
VEGEGSTSHCPGAALAATGIARGRPPAGGGGHHPLSRRAGCEQHKSGSVRGASGDRGAYSMVQAKVRWQSAVQTRESKLRPLRPATRHVVTGQCRLLVGALLSRADHLGLA